MVGAGLLLTLAVAAAAMEGDTEAAKATGLGHGLLRLRERRDWRIANVTALAARIVKPPAP